MGYGVGGTWVCWGRDNKEVPVRLCGSSPSPSHSSSSSSSSASPSSSSASASAGVDPSDTLNSGGGGNVKGGWNFEIKANDGTGPPHLSLAALLASGLLGIQTLVSSLPSSKEDKATSHPAIPKELRLMEESVDVAIAADLPAATRQKMGIIKKMPISFGEALRALEEDRELGALLGEEVVRGYLSVARVRFIFASYWIGY